MKTICRATVILSLAVCGHVRAGDEITLFAVDTGWYDMTGFSQPDNINYLVGDALDNNFHNFSVFDLSSITLPIQSATLMLYNGASPPNNENGYISRDPFETYALYDVTTDIGVLTGGFGGVGAYDDLAGGTFYGSVDATEADNGTFVVVELNSDGIAALNSAEGLFAFGGNITTISHPIDVQESVFWWSQQSPDVRLVVTVGEPCSWDLDGNGSVGASDLLSLLASWGPCKGCPADFDGDGNVGASDLLALLVNWGPCP